MNLLNSHNHPKVPQQLDREFSAWLMPSRQQFEFIDAVVRNLSTAHGTPYFEAHLTLFYGTCAFDHVPKGQTAVIASSVKPFELKLTPGKIGFTESNYTQAMYLELELPDWLRDFSARLRWSWIQRRRRL